MTEALPAKLSERVKLQWLAVLVLIVSLRNTACVPTNDVRLVGSDLGDAKAAEFSLRNQDGQMVTSASLQGKTGVFAFVGSSCGELCTEPATFHQVQERLRPEEAGRVRFILISTDAADTAGSGSDLLRRHALSGRADYLVGSAETLSAARSSLSGGAKNSSVVVVDQAGRPRVALAAEQLTPESLVTDIRLLDSEGLRN